MQFNLPNPASPEDEDGPSGFQLEPEAADEGPNLSSFSSHPFQLRDGLKYPSLSRRFLANHSQRL